MDNINMENLEMDGDIHRQLAGGGIEYADIMMLALFFGIQWYLGRVAMAFKFPTIPIEIAVGMLFGPSMPAGSIQIDLIPEFSHNYSPLQLAGFIGVGIVIFESGMHLDIKKVANWDMGVNVIIIACLGTALPILLGCAFMIVLGSEPRNAYAAGFALAPTSVGISLALLGKAKQLNSRMGQIIMSAAFLDDIFSIVCLVVLTNLAKGDLDPVRNIIVPMIYAFAFVGIGIVGSVYLPKVFPYMIDSSSYLIQMMSVDNRTMNLRDEMHMFWMAFSYCIFSYIASIDTDAFAIGSSLLGNFVAGMLFSQIPRSHHIWEKQFKRINKWLLRLFFSATIGFAIPVDVLLTGKAFAGGLLIGAIPCCLAKIFSGLFVGPERFVVGVAMMARGEFAYFVGGQALYLGMITEEEFAIVIWALLWATFSTPIIFEYVLKIYVREEFEKLPEGARSNRIGGNKFSGESSFLIHYFCAYQVGMVHELVDCLFAMGFTIKNSVTESKGSFGMGTFEVHVRQAISFEKRYGNAATLLKQEDSDARRRSMKYKMATDLTDEKLDEIAHHLKEVLNDEDAKVIFEPAAKNEEDEPLVAIELFGNGHRSVLDDIMQMLKDRLNVEIKGTFEHNATSNAQGKKHYTSIYCSRKLEDPEEVKIVHSHIRRSISKKIEFKADECSNYRNEIRTLLKAKKLTECDVMVRMMHSDSVVYTTSALPSNPGAASDEEEISGGTPDGQVKRRGSNGMITARRRSSGSNIVVDRKFSLSDVDLTQVMKWKSQEAKKQLEAHDENDDETEESRGNIQLVTPSKSTDKLTYSAIDSAA